MCSLVNKKLICCSTAKQPNITQSLKMTYRSYFLAENNVCDTAGEIWNYKKVCIIWYCFCKNVYKDFHQNIDSS